MSLLAVLRTTVLLIWVAACAPTLNWREVSADGRSLVALFPCSPDRQVRAVHVGADQVSMTMAWCTGGASTFAVAYADVVDPGAVTEALAILRRAAIANMGASAAESLPFELPGATPNPTSGRIHVLGRLPDGTRAEVHSAFFVQGLRLYQASLVGTSPSPATVDAFFKGLRFAR